MHRFFVSEKINNQLIINKPIDVHHIVNVIKLNQSDKLEAVFDNTVFLTKFDKVEGSIVFLNIIEEIKFDTNTSKAKKILIMGLIREQRWDWLLEKATELGVDIIVPVQFKRNVVKIDDKKNDNKLRRWSMIIETAAKQSKRINIPIIMPIVRDLNKLNDYVSDINIVAYENEKDRHFKSVIVNQFKSISFIIGPEGGLEEKEINQLNKIGFESITLGQNILRAETAPLYILSNLI